MLGRPQCSKHGQVKRNRPARTSQRYTAVPFFWTQHYDVSFDYVGHAQAHDLALRFRKDGRTLAVATIFRGRESLSAERAMV